LRNSGAKSAPKFQPSATKAGKSTPFTPPQARSESQTEPRTAQAQVQKLAMCALPRPCDIWPGDVRGLHATSKKPEHASNSTNPQAQL